LADRDPAERTKIAIWHNLMMALFRVDGVTAHLTGSGGCSASMPVPVLGNGRATLA
jgi:hypothetical protein